MRELCEKRVLDLVIETRMLQGIFGWDLWNATIGVGIEFWGKISRNIEW